MTNHNYTYINGIKGTEFVAEYDVFNNTCYCPSSGCLLPGVRSLGLCGNSALPIYISFPHFYLADESYIQPIIGMKPNNTLHEFKMILDNVSVYRILIISLLNLFIITIFLSLIIYNLYIITFIFYYRIIQYLFV